MTLAIDGSTSVHFVLEDVGGWGHISALHSVLKGPLHSPSFPRTLSGGWTAVGAVGMFFEGASLPGPPVVAC